VTPLRPKLPRKNAALSTKHKKRSARRSTPSHPITMASTAEPPDPMPYALDAILLLASRARGCRMQRDLFPGVCWVRAGTYVFGPFLRAGCAGAAWMRGGSLGTSMGAGRRCLSTRAGGGLVGSPVASTQTRVGIDRASA
jgi:hypothetical protein